MAEYNETHKQSSITQLADETIAAAGQLRELTVAEQILDRMSELFQDIYKRQPERRFFSPGRVNLIGDHIDYNGGSVFPCALTLGTYALVLPRSDRKVGFCSLNYPQQGIVTAELDSLNNLRSDGWTNYAKGMIRTLAENGYPLKQGFDSVVFGNIPTASGLSSSASIELLYGVIVRDLGEYSEGELDGVKLAQLAQRAENEFIGVNCGIMDQFAIAMGRREQAILLNTDTLNYKYAPLHFPNLTLVIANTNKKRGLADSKYNERRSECETALADLQTELKIDNLCALKPKELELHKHLIKSETCYRRARHAISEQQRVLDSLQALSTGDAEQFGKLMNQSHDSLRNDYEVTGIELDTLVSHAQQFEGCLGARVTGAGFGGCTVNLVQRDLLDEFISQVGQGYAKAIGYRADFYIVAAGDGAGRLA